MLPTNFPMSPTKPIKLALVVIKPQPKWCDSTSHILFFTLFTGNQIHHTPGITVEAMINAKSPTLHCALKSSAHNNRITNLTSFLSALKHPSSRFLHFTQFGLNQVILKVSRSLRTYHYSGIIVIKFDDKPTILCNFLKIP